VQLTVNCSSNQTLPQFESKPESKQAVGKHFSQDGHEKKDMSIIPFEKIQSKDPWIRIAREKYYIKLFDASINVKMN
jgi:hypothetical protein